MNDARAVALPGGSRIARLFAGADLADAYAIRLPSGSSRDTETLVRFMLGERPVWLSCLMSLRDTMVAGFGIKTSRQLREGPDRIYISRVYETAPDEIILGEDDKHLDFRISAPLRAGGAATELVVTTVVHCHNRLGRSYIALIAPFHRLVVRSMLRRASRRGWPKA